MTIQPIFSDFHRNIPEIGDCHVLLYRPRGNKKVVHKSFYIQKLGGSNTIVKLTDFD